MPQEVTNDVIANGAVNHAKLASPLGGPVNESQGADIASASTVNLTTATGNYAVITGTTAITAITLAQGARRTVRFAGALTLTNGASLILPSGANITTAAGDIATFVGEASSVVRCVQYQRADGTALVAPSTDLFFRLNSGVAGANATGAQSLFGAGVTLAGSTVYQFEITAVLLKSAGTTSHNVSLLFGGTATLNNIGYEALSANGSGVSNTGVLQGFSSAATAFAVASGINQTTQYVTVIVNGSVSVNAGGTFIPQYSLSAAPGGAYTTQIGSFVRLRVLGASGANNSSGTWA
jgi:hypothetical protein